MTADCLHFRVEVSQSKRRRVEDGHSRVLAHPELAVGGKAREEFGEEFNNGSRYLMLGPGTALGKRLPDLSAGDASDVAMLGTRERGDRSEEPHDSFSATASSDARFLKDDNLRIVTAEEAIDADERSRFAIVLESGNTPVE